MTEQRELKASEVLSRFEAGALRILVVGDAMIDTYYFGLVGRICPEAPVPVFVTERTDTRAGGAANVFTQLSHLGIDTRLFAGINRSSKRRYMVGHHLLLRVDADMYNNPSAIEIQDIAYTIEGHAWLPHAVVLSDYAKGQCSPRLCQRTIEAARARGIPVIVDPKGADWEKYAGATVICPNEAEWEAVNCTVPEGSTVLAKHGAKGLAVVGIDSAGGQVAQLFPSVAQKVYDVTGAGDTVVALVAATLAAGGTLSLAAVLANVAAGVVVAKVGTSTCSLEELSIGVLG